MALGPGKYDEECGMVRLMTRASAVLLIVVGGTKGGGFSAQVTDPTLLVSLPAILRKMATDMETP